MQTIIPIGITETGDPSQNFSWMRNLQPANIIITKRISNRLANDLLLYEVTKKCILHIGCTGYGGTILEPNVPSWTETLVSTKHLIKEGFPANQIVLRVDPIIPTPKGIDLAIQIMDKFTKETDINRIRISFMDMYPHVKQRFIDADIALPYESFHAPESMQAEAAYRISMFVKAHKELNLSIESCAESAWPDIIQSGCISIKDLQILGLQNDIHLIGQSGQRQGCRCPANKKQILTCKPEPCKHNCLYCFWKQKQ